MAFTWTGGGGVLSPIDIVVPATFTLDAILVNRYTLTFAVDIYSRCYYSKQIY